MNEQAFPTAYYIDTLVRLLDIIKHDDNNYSREERVANLRYAYSVGANHFAQSVQREVLKVSPKKLEATLSTIVMLVVYSWTKVSRELRAALSIHLTYCCLLDDSSGDPHPEMATFYQDLLQGAQQKHPWWRLVNGHLPKLLSHFGPFCAFNIVRSTFDFFQGCWIEQHNFHGFPGSQDFPLFLRRLNGLGHTVGASIFPKAQFDEQALFPEIASVLAQMDKWIIFVNDMMSFYKEFDDPRDQTSLLNNYCHVGKLGLDQALDKLTADTIRSSEQLVAVFEGKDPNVEATLKAFVQGYVTWHLCDKRYRMKEVYESCGDGPIEGMFRRYYEKAREVGGVQVGEWTVPSVTTLAEQADKPSLWSLSRWFAGAQAIRS